MVVKWHFSVLNGMFSLLFAVDQCAFCPLLYDSLKLITLVTPASKTFSTGDARHQPQIGDAVTNMNVVEQDVLTLP